MIVGMKIEMNTTVQHTQNTLLRLHWASHTNEMSNYYGSSSSNPYQQDTKTHGADPYNVNFSSTSAGSQSNDPYSNRMDYNQQWQPSSHAFQNQSQQKQQQQQQQQQFQGGSTPFWNPNMASTFASVASTAVGSASNPNAMFDLGIKAGHTFLDQGTARMIPGLERIMRELRVYFAVDNSYVKAKMQRVLFSFFYKVWKRTETDDSTTTSQYNSSQQQYQSQSLTMKQYALPTNDDNALDLYIPTMSLITYVLLCGLCYGTSGQFDPEFLPDVTTRCVVVQIIEVLAFRLGFYLMQVPTCFMDLFAVTGYKYLGLALNMLVGYSLSIMLETGGHRGYYVMFLWTATAMSYFMLKFMANNIPLMTNASGPKRDVVVLAFAGTQFASMWFLGQTRFLN
mmetsp:Transcript_16689/g.31620  ORF Transcript_16689/g.31620 Transcript_16689/m.31620 type:complete len:396 (+) Transcript_16689:17-1204(+)